jgi:Exopolysaccharide biosynthesis protein YbjH
MKRFLASLLLTALPSLPILGYAKDLPAPNTGERMSVYLSRLGLTNEQYLEGLCWSTDNSRQAQAQRLRRLRLSLSSVPNELSLNTSLADKTAWSKLLDALIPAGCAPLPVRDPQYMALVPSTDPVLNSEDQIRLLVRPTQVAVITPDKNICRVDYQPMLATKAYLQACGANESSGADLIQPGSAEPLDVGLASWNANRQPSPAPGAWIIAHGAYSATNKWFEDDLRKVIQAQGAFHERSVQLPALVSPNPDQVSRSSIQSKPLPNSTDYTDLVMTASDWGVMGLLQTPSARIPKAGYAALQYSKTWPYTRLNFMLAPFDWLEAGFRYVDVANRLYGPTIADNQSYKDKSIDAKFRLWQESAYLPQVAVGFRDLVGTGLFSGEYLVASKRFGEFGNWDANLGMGWGYVGGRQDIDNPLGALYSKYKTRPTSTESSTSGGKFNLSTYFRGPAALFGGVQYQFGNNRWVLKAEYDGNNYQNEPQSNDQKQSSPINLGVVYRPNKWLDVTTGLERGNRLMLGITLYTDLSSLSTPKLSEPRPMPIRPLPLAAQHESVAPSPTNYSDIRKSLEAQVHWRVSRIVQRDRELRVEVAEHDVFDWNEAIDRANAVLHNNLPSEIKQFAYVVVVRGQPVETFVVDRQDWVKSKTELARHAEKFNQPPVFPTAIWREVPRDSLVDQTKATAEQPIVTGGLGFTYKQSFGGPNGFILAQLSAQAEGELRMTESSWLYGSLEYGLLDNYKDFDYTAPSNLPRVRTYVREYVTSSDLTLPTLQATTTGKWSDDLYWSAYGGLLESMYAGVGAEMLYRPRFMPSVALGFDVNRVRQRGFKQDFSLRAYEVTTGHATLYWKTGWQDIVAKLSAGQYLAADRGVTIDLAREFNNGVRIGAFMTRTNVSAAQFGEGSFDKGIYVSIPFDVMMTRASNNIANIIWRPLTRDGGAKLSRKYELYEMTRLGR